MFTKSSLDSGGIPRSLICCNTFTVFSSWPSFSTFCMSIIFSNFSSKLPIADFRDSFKSFVLKSFICASCRLFFSSVMALSYFPFKDWNSLILFPFSYFSSCIYCSKIWFSALKNSLSTSLFRRAASWSATCFLNPFIFSSIKLILVPIATYSSACLSKIPCTLFLKYVSLLYSISSKAYLSLPFSNSSLFIWFKLLSKSLCASSNYNFMG